LYELPPLIEEMQKSPAQTMMSGDLSPHFAADFLFDAGAALFGGCGKLPSASLAQFFRQALDILFWDRITRRHDLFHKFVIHFRQISARVTS
jgi:hypothetical protein